MTHQPPCAGERAAGLQRRIAGKLAGAHSALLLGVGGGNDSVTTLLARSQLAGDYGFAPARTVVAAMLPDILDYHEVAPAAAPRVWRVLPESRRSLQGLPIRAFPEPLLAREGERFGIERVLGIWLSAGSEGVYESLRELVRAEGFDLVLACDV